LRARGETREEDLELFECDDDEDEDEEEEDNKDDVDGFLLMVVVALFVFGEGEGEEATIELGSILELRPLLPLFFFPVFPPW